MLLWVDVLESSVLVMKVVPVETMSLEAEVLVESEEVPTTAALEEMDELELLVPVLELGVVVDDVSMSEEANTLEDEVELESVNAALGEDSEEATVLVIALKLLDSAVLETGVLSGAAVGSENTLVP